MKIKIDPLYAPDDAAAAADAVAADAVAGGAASAPGTAAAGTLLDAAATGAQGTQAAEGAGEVAKETPEAKAEREAAEAAAAKLAEVPDDGKYEFALPEGVTLNEKLAEIASPKLKELGITRSQANGLAGVIASHEQAQAEVMQADWAKTNAEWAAASRADAEYGGDKFNSSLEAAQRALDKFGTPGLREYLTASGGGNHPEMIRLMARVGNAFSDDRPVGSETPAKSQTKSHAEILYGPQA